MRRLRLIYRGGSRPEELAVEVDGSRCTFSHSGSISRGELTRLPDGRVSLLFEDGRQLCGRILTKTAGAVELVKGGESRKIALADPLRDHILHARDHAAGDEEDEEVRALMPGRVVEVAVSAGASVAAGALLVVLEAMKMQNEIRTVRGGVVARIDVEAGVAVEGGALLAVVRARDGPDRAIQ